MPPVIQPPVGRARADTTRIQLAHRYTFAGTAGRWPMAMFSSPRPGISGCDWEHGKFDVRRRSGLDS